MVRSMRVGSRGFGGRRRRASMPGHDKFLGETAHCAKSNWECKANEDLVFLVLSRQSLVFRKNA
jgi:hypothetical protein